MTHRGVGTSLATGDGQLAKRKWPNAGARLVAGFVSASLVRKYDFEHGVPNEFTTSGRVGLLVDDLRGWQMDMLSLSEGSVFAGRYRIIRRIAQGGMGVVYEVVHLDTTRHRALKVMLPSLVENDELRQRFQLEARVSAKIESAHLVDVFDAGIDEATKIPFLVMALLRGEELGKRLKRLGRFGYDEVVELLRQVALALDKTHRAHVVHRDLKPENLFLAEEEGEPPCVKVLDFGIAKFVAEHGTPIQATRSIGTPLYMAPEQFLPGAKVRPTTDIYALGMIAYTFLVGKPYWLEEQQSGGNVFAFIRAVMFGPTESATLRAKRQNVLLPEAFDPWFQRMTAKEPDARYSPATHAIAHLAHALGVSSNGRMGQETGLFDPTGERISYATTLVKPLFGRDRPPAERVTASMQRLVPLIQPSEEASLPDQALPLLEHQVVDEMNPQRKWGSLRWGGVALLGLGICSVASIARYRWVTSEATMVRPVPAADVVPEVAVPISSIAVSNDPLVPEKPLVGGNVPISLSSSAAPTAPPAKATTTKDKYDAPPSIGRPNPVTVIITIGPDEPIRD